MDRKKFLKNSLLSAAGITVGKTLIAADSKNPKSTHDKLLEQVGFNHLPQEKTERTMRTVLHKAQTRGHANHGWLDTHHSFSFASYYNPERMNFGVLRVLNDDRVDAGKGFGKHPHDNMEIISIPLEGDLEHQDSMGNKATIKQGDVQVMSAGTGIFHSEYNPNADKLVKFLQIWVFPNKRNVEPRYDQITLDEKKLDGDFHQILSPNANDEGVWIHQNAWFHLGELKEGQRKTYRWKGGDKNGLYVFVLEGEATVEGQKLTKRDGFGIWDTQEVQLKADTNTKLLLLEVPMELKQE